MSAILAQLLQRVSQRLQLSTCTTLLQSLLYLQSTHNAGTPSSTLCRRRWWRTFALSALHVRLSGFTRQGFVDRLSAHIPCNLDLVTGVKRDQVMMGQPPPRYPRQVNLNSVGYRFLWCCNGRWWVMRRHDCNVTRSRDRQYSFQSTTSVNIPINTTTYITSLANKPLYLLWGSVIHVAHAAWLIARLCSWVGLPATSTLFDKMCNARGIFQSVIKAEIMYFDRHPLSIRSIWWRDKAIWFKFSHRIICNINYGQEK